MPIRINTSNPNKLKEYQGFLGLDVIATHVDLKEPAADLLTIIRYKAAQFENVLVEDVSLEVEGAQVGVQVRWLLDRLPEYLGRAACFHCWIGVRQDQKIKIYKGQVSGRIVAACGKDFGFNAFFLPDGAERTLAEEKKDIFNPRFVAVKKFLADAPDEICEPIFEWAGAFQ